MASIISRRLLVGLICMAVGLVGFTVTEAEQEAGAVVHRCATIGPRPISAAVGKVLGIIRPKPTTVGRRCVSTSPALAPRLGNASGALTLNEQLYGSKKPVLKINQGHVMGTPTQPGAVTLIPIYWSPADHSLPAGYQGGISKFDVDLAAASGEPGDIFSVQTQYTDASGRRLAYDYTAAAPIVDTASLPSPTAAGSCDRDTGAVYGNGSGYFACITDAQIIAELARVIAAEGLPLDDAHLYTMVTPKGVEVCFGSSNSAQGGTCTVSYATSSSGFCAYHSTGMDASAAMVYTVLPFPVWNSPTGLGCSDSTNNQSPSGNPDLDVALSSYSHEISEAVTDPAGDGWHDVYFNENGDLCSYTYGATQGAQGQGWNQTINSAAYYLQLEFSNAAYKLDHANGCQASWSLPQVRLAVTLLSAVKKQSTFTATPTFSSGKIATYAWKFDGVEKAGGAAKKFIFKTAGSHTVSVTVTDVGGYSATASTVVSISP